ncbi:GNAT family N-acetyltransferase [Oryzobacter telluris]|uniref:GNAT family N-acetyltransferase n=1 Tax=Oryzobacter telluris TaxID=3149179 RepID=UPI00370D90BE
MSTPVWRPLTEDDLSLVHHLAACCLERDGGLPHLAGEPMLRRYFLQGPGIVGTDETGDVIAAASVFVDGTGHRTAAGLVHPSARGQGLGHALVAWCRERSGGSLLRVAVETTSPEWDALVTELGLVRTFAEHVMRHDLVDVPRIKRPAGLTSERWTDETAPLFHEAYRRSFSDRPGFPDPPLEEWVGDVAEEEGFRPTASRVVLDAAGTPVGFVTLLDDWIDQVGVVPAWRGRGLGAHLVVRSLRALRKVGCEQAWLTVNVDNAAHDLYLRVGFRDAGLRARYEETVR